MLFTLLKEICEGDAYFWINETLEENPRLDLDSFEKLFLDRFGLDSDDLRRAIDSCQ